MGLNGEVFGYRSYGSTFTTYGSTLTIYGSTITTYGSRYAKNVLELILMVNFRAISIILYIYHPNKNYK